MIYTTHYESPVGRLLLAGQEEALAGLWIEGQKYFPDFSGEETAEDDSRIVFRQTRRWLDAYFAGERPAVSELNLSPSGSEFRRAVWELLCEIPYGQLTTYGEIAGRLAKQSGRSGMSAQAVGGAVGHNPISIIIPCHRVVGSNGSLTGYAGGIDVKVKLLEMEGADMSKLFVPAKGTAL